MEQFIALLLILMVVLCLTIIVRLWFDFTTGAYRRRLGWQGLLLDVPPLPVPLHKMPLIVLCANGNIYKSDGSIDDTIWELIPRDSEEYQRYFRLFMD